MGKPYSSYLLAFLSSLFYSLNQVFNKKLTLALGSLPALFAVYCFLVLFDGLFCLLFGSFKVPPPALVELVFLALVGVLSILFFFEGFKRLPLGVAVTLANFSPVFLTVLVFLSERKLPPPPKLALVVALVITVAVFFGGGEKGRLRRRYLFYPLMTAFGWGLFGWETYRLVNLYDLNPFTVAFYSSLFMWLVFLLACLRFCRLVRLLELLLTDRRLLRWAALSGGFTSLGFVLSVFAFKGLPPEEAPVVEAILTFTTPLTAFTSYLLLGEKLSTRQTLGVVVSFLLLVAFFLA
ncbi:MAG: DMT family transporter [Aquificae bacterium]|nr:DMT family transporter [Aquificota bacterium]